MLHAQLHGEYTGVRSAMNAASTERNYGTWRNVNSSSENSMSSIFTTLRPVVSRVYLLIRQEAKTNVGDEIFLKFSGV